MSPHSQTNEDDLLLSLLGDYDFTCRVTASPSTAMLVDREEDAVDPLLRSPLTEDASFVAKMFEREAGLGVGGGDGASSAGASASVQVSDEVMIGKRQKERVAIKEREDRVDEDVEIKCSEARRDKEYYTARRTRSAEVHNRCERRRRGKINQRFKALQKLVPRCNDKSDKVSILDETIIYMKNLQQQIQMISSGGCGITQMVFPAVQACMLPSAALCMCSNCQPMSATADQVMAGVGSCPVYPSLPYGLFGRGRAVTVDSASHQPASWPLFPPSFQSMSRANYGQAMDATTNQPYQVPNAPSSQVNGYGFLGHSL